ncbi:MAG: formylglycine-generating enzyme family protein [Candidatus Hydrogenedentota bacterium]|nr:MAG: formylglycine-generating enzyme family protein [Candidatus Hydrogenedentota bacterium]
MSCIPGGTFIRGSNLLVKKLDTGKLVRDEAPPAKIYVSAFLMDKKEVSLKEFQECQKAGKCRKSARPNYLWARRNPNGPMLGVSWYDAQDYCHYRGKRLPTEAEWEKAARGPNGDMYPWGNEKPTCKLAIIKENGKRGCGTGITHDVGARGPFRYGLYDMAGNAHEWVADWYSESYEKCGKACFKKNPKGPCDGKEPCPGYHEKVVKGGSWYWEWDKARASWRRPHDPHNSPRYHHFGFRCAKDIQ